MSDIRITGGSLSIVLTETGHGAALTEVTDGNRPIFSHCGQPFFGLSVRSGEEERAFLSHTDFESFSAETHANGASLRFSAPGGLEGIEVLFSAAAEENGIRFTGYVVNHRTDCTITEVEYPRFWFDPTPESRYFCPTGCGLVMQDLHTGPHRRRMRYPSYQASMSYCAVYDAAIRRGVYVGYEDEGASLKHLMIRRAEGEDGSCLSCALPSQFMGKVQNSQPIPGVCVWRLFDGDWYDAAMEYKKFALSARWMPELDEFGLRRHRNEKLGNIGHWWVDFVDDNNDADELIRLSGDLGVPCAAHVYQWHQIPFDNDYPHYFPEKDVFPEYLRKLRAANIPAMPYINGRLWDTRDRGLEDYQFTALAKPHTVKDTTGEPITEWYAVREADDSYVLYGVMCPTTAFWQDKLAEISREILQRLDCDGLYIDQTASAPPRMCCDPRHDHDPGNGSWWTDSCRTAVSRIAREGGPDKFITSEGTTDAYFRCFDAFLGWSWWYNGQIPALTAVYGGIALCFGRQYGDIDDDTMRIFAAQAYTFGEQLGWISTLRFKNADEFTRNFYTACVRESYAGRNFLLSGMLCRPPEIRTDAACLSGKSSAEAISSPPVLASVWQDRKTLRRRLFLAAPGKEACTVSLRVEALDKLPVFSGNHTVSCDMQDGMLTLTLPGGAVLWADL